MVFIVDSLITSSGNDKVVRALIELGAKVNAESEDKKTPLQLANERGMVTNADEIEMKIILFVLILFQLR